MDLSVITGLLAQAGKLPGGAQRVGVLIQAGTEVARVVRATVEEAAATLQDGDAARLRERAAELSLTNRALSEQVEDALRG